MLQWYRHDGATPLPGLTFGVVGPGETYFEKHSEYIQAVLKNLGGATVNDVVVEFLPVDTFMIHEYVEVAVGATQPDPGEFVDYASLPLDVGNIAPSGEVRLWFNCVVPAYAQRLTGQYARIRAYGA